MDETAREDCAESWVRRRFCAPKAVPLRAALIVVVLSAEPFMLDGDQE